MKKIFSLTYIFLMSLSALAAEFNERWDDNEGNIFRLKTVSYDDNIVKIFNNIVYNFHKNDAGANKDPRDISATEAFEKFSKEVLEERAKQFKEGASSLLLVYKNDTIAGGTYFIVDDKHQAVRMTCVGYDETILGAETSKAKIKTIEYFSSRRNFPNKERVVVFIRHDSHHIEQLKLFNFKESNYPIEPRFAATHLVLESPMQ